MPFYNFLAGRKKFSFRTFKKLHLSLWTGVVAIYVLFRA